MNVHVTISVELEKLKAFDAWRKAEGWKSRSEALAWLMTSVRPSAGKEEEEAPY